MVSTFNDFQLAFENNFYDIMEPPKKKQYIKNRDYEEEYYQEIQKNEWIQSTNIGGLDTNVDYNHKIFVPDYHFYIDGLLSTNALQKILSLDNLPKDEYVLCVYVRSKEKKEMDECIKVYLTSKVYPNIYKKGFVYYSGNSFSYNEIKKDWYEFKKMDKKIQHYKDFYPSLTAFQRSLEYRPNFFNNEFSDTKISDGEQNGEISLLPECGKVFRKKCFENNIYSYKDKKFDSFLKEEIKSQKKRAGIERVIFANSKNNKDWCVVDEKLFQLDEFKLLEQKMKENKVIYFDSEYISDGPQYLYGFYHQDGKFDSIWNADNEKELFQNVLHYCNQYSDHVFIYYSADKGKLDALFKKYNTPIPNGFYDLFFDLKVFLKDYYAFQGCYNFSIKSIEKVFIKQNLIDETYKESNCQNGMDSIFLFQEFQKTRDEKIKNDLIEYNRLDCKNQYIILNKLFQMK